MEIELHQNFARIIRTLEGQGMRTTKIAHHIGYSTTTQLYNSIEGKSLLSTKAIVGLILNLNVNPTYLFFGKGEMFLTAEDEIETLRREISEKTQKIEELQKTLVEQDKKIVDLQAHVSDIINLSSAAREYYKIKYAEKGSKIESNNEDQQ
jgi:hypothetical protein